MERIEKARVLVRVMRASGVAATVQLGTAYRDSEAVVGGPRAAGYAATWSDEVADAHLRVTLLEVHAEGASQLELAQAEQTIGRLQARERSLTGDLLAARQEAGQLRSDLGAAHERIVALEAEVAALQRLLRRGDGAGA